MSSSTIATKGRRAGRSPWVERLGRLGLVAKGVLYAVVGILAIKVALGGREESPDREGALQTIAQQPFGKGLLVLLAVGLAGYALWQLARGLLDREGEGEDPKGLAKRAERARARRSGTAPWPCSRRERVVSAAAAAAARRSSRRPPASSTCLSAAISSTRAGLAFLGVAALQRLPRRHVQVQEEAEDRGDERCRGGVRDRRRRPRPSRAGGRLRADRALPPAGRPGSSTPRRRAGSTAR